MSDVYLIPSFLSEHAVQTIPPYVMDAVEKCDVLFVEQIRTARRFLKSMNRNIDIDRYQWYEMNESEEIVFNDFKKCVKEQKNIGIISEAGCPGVADPGQSLVDLAHQLSCRLIPLVGPSSILLALMASGFNGQHFEFLGYLPIDAQERKNKLKAIENDSIQSGCTKIFIETPYRNNQMLESILQICRPETRLCIASDLTGAKEFICTKSVRAWNGSKPELHKIPVIFLLSGS